MRKLIMWNLVTLDGYFEGEKNWDLPWLAALLWAGLWLKDGRLRRIVRIAFDGAA